MDLREDPRKGWREVEELQQSPTNQTFKISKTFHHTAHPNAGNESIYIEHSTCVEPFHSCRSVITFENLNTAKKSLKILLKQLDQLKTKEEHTFIITPDCKLYSAKEIYL